MADTAQDPTLPQKKRARRRVVGAAVLCLGLAVGLPFVFDAEPKKSTRSAEQVPINVTVAKPAANPTLPAPTSSAPNAAGTDSSVAIPMASPVPPVVAIPPPVEPDVPKQTPIETKAEVKAEVRADGKTEAKPALKPGTATPPIPSTVTELIAQGDKKKLEKQKADAAAKAAKSAPDTASAATPTKGKYLVQIGAFGSATGAQEQSKRATALGLKAFTEEISTNAGKRIRVRVGPFANKEQADKARDTLKAGGIDSALIAP
jgi:DedD protein